MSKEKEQTTTTIKEPKPPKDINNGLMVNDIVKDKNNGCTGRVDGFEWSGIRRALVENGSGGFYVIDVARLELVLRPEVEQIKEEVK